MLDISSEILNSGLEVDAVLTTASGSHNIKVLFNNEFEMANILGIDAESSKPQMEYAESDRNGAIQGNSVVITDNGTQVFSGKIVDFEPDGHGFIISRLAYD